MIYDYKPIFNHENEKKEFFEVEVYEDTISLSISGVCKHSNSYRLTKEEALKMAHAIIDSLEEKQ